MKNLPQSTKTKEFNIGIVKVTKEAEVKELRVKTECKFSFEKPQN